MDRTPASAPDPHYGSRVVLRGELDLLTAPDTDRLLQETAESRPGCDLLIDLRQVTFADCAGLRPLTRAQRRAHEQGGTVTALVGSEQLLRVLELTRIGEAMVVLPAIAPPVGSVPGSGRRVPGQQRPGRRPRGSVVGDQRTLAHRRP